MHHAVIHRDTRGTDEMRRTKFSIDLFTVNKFHLRKGSLKIQEKNDNLSKTFYGSNGRTQGTVQLHPMTKNILILGIYCLCDDRVLMTHPQGRVGKD